MRKVLLGTNGWMAAVWVLWGGTAFTDASQASLPSRSQAGLSERESAMAAYAEKLTLRPAEMVEADLEPLYAAGLDDHQIMELVQVVGMFNMTNRISTALGFLPNAEYHSQGR